MSEPLCVMHLRACNFVGGPEKQILEHFARLDPKRYRSILGTFVDNGVQDYMGEAARSRGIRSIGLQSMSPLDPRGVYKLAKVLQQEKVSILCTHGYKPNILGCIAVKIAGIKTIAISRGWTWESPKIKLYEWLDRFFLRVADHVVAVSEGQQKKILQCGLPSRKVSVIHNAINLDDKIFSDRHPVREELGIPQDSFLVVSAGRLSPEKNYSAMIAVAKRVVAENTSIYFAIFGEGFLRSKLEQQRDAAGLNGRLFFPGFREDIHNAFYSMDVFMLPSLTEGLPNVALEAFAARKPIVASAVGGTPEIVQHGISGFLAAPDDIVGMAESILRLAGNAGLRKRMGEAGYQYAATNFGFEAQTKKYEELYDTIYNRRHSSSQ